MYAKTLLKKVEALFNSVRERDRKICEEFELECSDLLADTTAVIKGQAVIVTYDGVGYNQLSYESELPCLLADLGFQPDEEPELRKKLRKLAEKCGFILEDHNSYQCGLYPC